MPDLMAVIDGKPVPLRDAAWIFFLACGCPYGACTAQLGDEAFATEDQALREMYPLKRDRDRFYKQGRRLELMSWDRYRAEIDLAAKCPHARSRVNNAARAQAEHSNPPGEPCHCGRPIPAGRVAYCSLTCQLADKDYGPDEVAEAEE